MKKIIIIFIVFFISLIKAESQSYDSIPKTKNKIFHLGISVSPNYVIGKLYENLDKVNAPSYAQIHDEKKQSLGGSFSFDQVFLFKHFFASIGEGIDFINYKGLFTYDYQNYSLHNKYYHNYNNKLLQVKIPITLNFLLGKRKSFYVGLCYDFSYIISAKQTILIQNFSFNSNQYVNEKKESYNFSELQPNSSYGCALGFRLLKTKKVNLNLSISLKQYLPINQSIIPSIHLHNTINL